MKIILAAMALVASIECYAEEDPFLKCQYRLLTDEKFSSLKQHLSLGTHRETTPEMLRDPTFPNEQQQKAIAQWMSAHSDCQSRSQLPTSESGPPALASRREELESAMISDAADLYQRRISFGEFNQRRQVLWARNGGEASKIRQPLRSETTY